MPINSDLQKPTLIVGRTAEAAVSKYEVLKKGTAESDVVKTAAATDDIVGLAMHDAAAGESVDVCMGGIHYGIGGAAGGITFGEMLMGDATPGRVGPVTGTAARHVIGKALGAAADGELVPILVNIHDDTGIGTT